VFAYGAGISRDFDEVAGQPSEQRGLASAKTATQADIMQTGSTARQDDHRNQLAESIREIYKKLFDSIQANMTAQMAVSIEGSDGQVFMAEIDHNMIVGDYDIEVDIADMMPENSDIMRAHKLQLMQIAGQNPWLFADEGAARGWCNDFNIRDEKFIQSIVRAAQMQMQMLMAPKQPAAQEAGPPQDEAQALAQAGGMA